MRVTVASISAPNSSPSPGRRPSYHSRASRTSASACGLKTGTRVTRFEPVSAVPQATAPPIQLLKLPVDDRVELAMALWESLGASVCRGSPLDSVLGFAEGV
jgi:hypothetical protein